MCRATRTSQQCASIANKSLTFWLAKLALLNTGLQGLIEEGIKHFVCGIDFVVGLDILLEGNTAVTEATVSHELITGMRRRQVNNIGRVKLYGDGTDLLPCLSLSY
jgi:hypothetical protein